jgi:hypothetical protein
MNTPVTIMSAWLATALAVLTPILVHAEEYPFDSETWKFTAAESDIVDYLGEQAVRIRGGYATINDLELQDGVIDFDIAVSSERGFSGVIFRAQDLANYEHFYIRPHQSGKPDANQYTPVFNGVSAWQLYHGEDYAAPTNYKFDEWMHIRVVFAGDQADVFIDSDEPTLHIKDLRRDLTQGGIGFGSGNFAAAHFANFRVTSLPANYQISTPESVPAEPPANIVHSWGVSKAMAADGVDEFLQSEQEWSEFKVESTGILNLARAPGVTPEKKTVIARLNIVSDKEQLKGLAFGYSDSVVVRVNDVPLYSGTNAYQTRDYRYLGTIGLFDNIFLPLKKGSNEISFIVSESFGGWGIQARFDDMEGISLQDNP